MDTPGTNSSYDNDELNQIITSYLKALEAESAPDRDELFKLHPDLADDLKSFFVKHDRTKEAAGAEFDAPTMPPSGQPAEETSIQAQNPPSEDATLPLSESQVANAQQVGSNFRYFGDFELLEEIARGGMGVVYKARQVSLNRTVAIKMILAGQLAGEEDVQRFYAEAEAAANLDHPGIVPIFEVGQHEGQHYFSMGFIEGKSLADRLHDGPLPPREAAALMKKIAEAVAFAHQRGVVHRDLKPPNVLLDQDGEPIITDFGLAKKMGDDSALTNTGQILGTPAYMPPEQAAGRVHELTETADIYALGAILYALLTGRPPFEAQSPIDTLVQVLESEPTLPTKVDRRVPRPLELICMRCLEKQPSARYPSAVVLAQDLDRFLKGDPVEARAADIWQRVRRWGRRQPALVAHLAMLFMGLLTIQITYLLIGTDLAYHLRHTSLLVLWGLVAVFLQQLLNRQRWAEVGAAAWAIADTILFTTVLYLSVPSPGPLLIGYALLVTASGLFFRVHLVIVTTLACALSYGSLLILRPELAETPHYCVTYTIMLLILGSIVAAQVRRIRKLNQYFENRI
jgi:serine/threonine-protein kinase